MMNRMLGFLPDAPELGVGESWAWPVATVLKSAAVATSNDKVCLLRFRFILVLLLLFGLRLLVELNDDS